MNQDDRKPGFAGPVKDLNDYARSIGGWQNLPDDPDECGIAVVDEHEIVQATRPNSMQVLDGKRGKPTSLSEKRAKKKGTVALNLDTLCDIFETDPAFAGLFAYDEMGERPVLTRKGPHENGRYLPERADAQKVVTEVDDLAIQAYLEGRFSVSIKDKLVRRAILVCSQKRRFHSLRDELKAMAQKWDGQNRCATWLHDYAGTVQDEYTSEVGLRWLISAVARALSPGCQADAIFVLEGKQGAGKDRLIRALAGDPKYLLERLPKIHDTKAAGEVLLGKWIVHISELGAIKGAEAEHVKSFISQTHDTFRRAYRSDSGEYARGCIFVGSTNETGGYLTDTTGNRRWWPVRVVNPMRPEEFAKARQQVLGEATARFLRGERWWFNGVYESKAEAERESREAEDPLTETITAILPARDRWSIAEIMSAMDIHVSQRSHFMSTRIGIVLRKLGYTPHGKPRKYRLGGPTW